MNAATLSNEVPADPTDQARLLFGTVKVWRLANASWPPKRGTRATGHSGASRCARNVPRARLFGQHGVGWLGEIQCDLAPGDCLRIPAQPMVRGRGVRVSPEPLQLGARVQAAAAGLLPQQVDRFACHLGCEGVIPSAAGPIDEAYLVGGQAGESPSIFH